MPAQWLNGKETLVNSSGKWEGRAIGDLNLISNNIEIDKHAGAERDVHSIPNVWARPILFANALLDENHPWHSRIYDEWLGLLAMLALRDSYSLKIDFTDIDLKNTATKTNNNITVLDLLYDLKPEIRTTELIGQESDWDKFTVIQLNGSIGKIPLGGYSPLSLVFTAPEYDLSTQTSISWYKNGSFKSTIEKISSNSKNKIEFCLYLETLASFLTQNPNDANNKLIGLINRAITQLNAPDTTGIRLSASTEKNLRSFIKESKVISNGSFQTDYLLKPLEGKNAPKLIILSKNILETDYGSVVYNNINSEEVAKSFERFIINSANKNKIFDSTLPSDVEWCIPEIDFFTDELVLISAKDSKEIEKNVAVPAGEGWKGIDNSIAFFPLNFRKILNYYELENGNQNIISLLNIMFRKNDTTILLSMTLLLENRKITIGKAYPKDKQKVLSVYDVPKLMFWPAKKMDNWNLYYLLCYSSVNYRVEPFSKPTNSLLHTNKQDENIGENNQLVIHDLNNAETLLLLRNENNKDLGGLILKKWQTISVDQNNAVWHVSIDFGTSNSRIYYSTEKGREAKPEIFYFKNNIRVINGYFNEPKYKGKYYQYFPIIYNSIIKKDNDNDFELSDEVNLEKIFSILKAFIPQTNKHYFLSGEPLFFLNTQKLFDIGQELSDIKKTKNISVKTDLKWSHKSESKIDLGNFISSMLLTVLAKARNEGIKNVEFNYTYPSSFSKEQMENYRDIWTEAVENIKEKLLLNESNISLNTPLTESYASGLYFSKKMGGLKESMITIDIGGGSTDISIWNGGRIILQSSVLFGGNELSGLLMNSNIEFEDLAKLDEGTASDYKQFIINKDISETTKFNIIMSAFGSNIKANWTMTKDQTNAIEFRRILSLFYSGLFYYIGILLRKTSISKLPAIFIGGHPSQFMEYLEIKKGTKEGFCKTLTDILLKSAEIEEVETNYDIVISKDVKSEASIGALFQPPHDNNIPTPILIFGESLPEFELTPETEMDISIFEKILKREKWENNDFKNFNKFIKLYNEFKPHYFHDELIADSEIGIQIKSRFGDLLSEVYGLQYEDISIQSLRKKEVTLEPLFIFVLKYYLEKQIASKKV